MKTKINKLKTSSLILIMYVSISLSYSNTITWTGIHNNEWNQVENWTPIIVPNLNDDVIIPSSWTTAIEINNANASCKTLNYHGSGFTLQIMGGWDLILTEEINLSGTTIIEGLGGIEIIGQSQCNIVFTNDVSFDIHHINIKNEALAVLHNDLYLPYGSINIFTGGFSTNGKEVTVDKLILIGGSNPRKLNIDNSIINAQIITLGLKTNGQFFSDNSVVNIKKLITSDASCQFNIINASSNVSIVTSEIGTDLTIEKLNATKDLNILGNINHTNQTYHIKEFNIMNGPAIITYTTQPYIEGYYFKKITSTSNCNGEILFTDGNEVNYNQVYIDCVEPVLFQKASFANIKVESANITSYSGRSLGNNNGINFLQSTPNNLYWIGGAGNWTDPTHWSYTSGGISAGCIPGLNDNALFDNNSGFGYNDTIKFNNHSFCRDLVVDSVIINKPIFAQPNGNIFQFMISGNVDLKSLQANHLEYPFILCSPDDIDLNLGLNILLNDLLLINKGTVKLRSTLNCRYGTKSVLQLLGGLKTNNHELNVAGIYSAGFKLLPSNRSLELGSSKIFIGHVDNTGGSIYVYSDSLQLNAGTSEIIFIHQLNMPHHIQIDGITNLVFHNTTFMNKTIYPFIRFNEKSSFNKITFHGNGRLVNGSSNTLTDIAGCDTLILSGNFRYEFENSKIIRISKQIMQQHGVCNELSLVTSDNLNSPAYIYNDNIQPLNLPNTWVENLHAIGTSLPIEVVGGVDGGSNTNFLFLSPNTPRIFYWNGESTTINWMDGSNWNLNQLPTFGPQNDLYLYNANGCIPGFNDSVVFTPNSFPINDTVFINGYVSFNGMCWTSGSGINRYLNGNSQFEFNNYGGSQFDNYLTISFSGDYMLRSPFHRQLRFNNVTYPGNIVFYNLGQYNLEDQMTCSGYCIEFRAGSFKSNNYKITANNLFITHYNAPMNNQNVLNFDYSDIFINGIVAASLYNNVSQLVAINTQFKLSSPNGYFYLLGDMPNFDIGSIRYTNSNGLCGFNSTLYSSSNFPHIRKMEFEPSGVITGNNSIDSVYLAEGKEYSIGSNQTQQINNILYSKGSPCYRTTINATTPGVRAYITNPSCNLIIEHARVRDIEGILGSCSTNNYLVGIGGEDLGNNLNWNFIPGDPINGLGIDTLLTCYSIPYQQLTTGFGRFNSIKWMDGSEEPTYTVTGNDTLSVTITYSPVCIIQDVRIFQFDPQMHQSAETTHIRCYGQMDGKIKISDINVDSNFTQHWVYPNQTIEPNQYLIENLGPGTYTSIITLPGYENLCSDTSEFTIVEPGQLNVVIDTTIPGKCNVAEGIILSTTTGGTGEYKFMWNDNSLQDDRYDAISGLHTIIVNDENGCVDSATAILHCIDKVIVPELLTPNGDGLGDDWEIIDLLRLYPNNNVSIFNRWGGKVYQKESYNNEFTGISNTDDSLGKGYLPSGTYFFHIDLGEGEKFLTGYLELIY